MYAKAELNAILKYAGILASSAREDLLPEKINLKVNTFTYYKSFFSYYKQIIINKKNKSRFIMFEKDWREVAPINLQNQD